MVVELVKVFNFSDKKPGFLEIIEVCPNLGIRFCITCLVLLNYKTISPWKPILATLSVSHLKRTYALLSIYFVIESTYKSIYEIVL